MPAAPNAIRRMRQDEFPLSRTRSRWLSPQRAGEPARPEIVPHPVDLAVQFIHRHSLLAPIVAPAVQAGRIHLDPACNVAPAYRLRPQAVTPALKWASQFFNRSVP